MTSDRKRPRRRLAGWPAFRNKAVLAGALAGWYAAALLNPAQALEIKYVETVGNQGGAKDALVRFGAPRRAACDPAGNLYVLGVQGGFIQKFNQQYEIVWTAQLPLEYRLTGTDIVTDGEHVWVSDYQQNPRIRRYRAADGAPAEIPFETPFGWWPWALGLQQDQLFAGFIHEVNQVWVYNKNTGAKIMTLPIPQARKLYFNAAGDLYVYGWAPCKKYTKASGYKTGAEVDQKEMEKTPLAAVTNDQTAVEATAMPEMRFQKARAAVVSADGLTLPEGIAPGNAFGHVTDIGNAINTCVNPVTGDMLVVDEGHWGVFVFDAQGKFKRKIKCVLPRAVAMDAEGNVLLAGGTGEKYAAKSGQWTQKFAGGQGIVWHEPSRTFYVGSGGRIARYAADGKLQAMYPPAWNYQGFPEHLEFHRGMAVLADALFFSEPLQGAVRKINLELRGEAQDALTGLEQPSGLAFDKAGNLYVASAARGWLRKYAPAGAEWKLAWEKKDLKQPQGLAVGEPYLFVAERGSCAIRIYTLDGALVQTFGGQGDGGSQFREPYAVAAKTEGGRGYLLVADPGNWRVQKFELHFAADKQ